MIVFLIYLICIIVFFNDEYNGIYLFSVLSYPITFFWILGVFTDFLTIGSSAITLFPFILWNILIDIMLLIKKFIS